MKSEKRILFIKGYSKTSVEIINDRKIIQLYIDFFTSNAGGAFDFDSEIIILENLEKRINRLVPKYAYGGTVRTPLTREESIEKFNKAIQESKEGTLYLFACEIDESAFNYFFLQVIIDISIYLHEYFRDSIYSAGEVFEHAKFYVNKLSKSLQTPTKIGSADFRFVLTII